MATNPKVQIIVSALDKASSTFDKVAENAKSAAKKSESFLKRVGNGFKAAGDKMKSIGAGMSKYITAPIVAAGVAAFKASDDIGDAMSTIQVGTGATGKKLKGLGGVLKSVMKSVPTSAGDAADAIATLNTATGASGKVLKGLTSNVLEASRVLHEDGTTNAKKFGQVLNQWKIPAKKGSASLDELYVATQKYGIGLGGLMDQLNRYGPILQNAGFSMDESADLFGRLHKAGISVSRIMPGLNQAMRKWAKANKDPQEELKKTTERIKNAKSGTEALKIAQEVYGAQGAQRMVTAVRNGSFSLDKLGDSLKKSKGSVKKAGKENRTFSENMQVLKNKVELALVPLGDELVKAFQDLEPYLEKGIKWVANLAKKFSNLSPRTKKIIVVVGALVAALGPVITVLGAVVGALGALLNPVGLVVAAVVGLGAVVAVVIAKWKPIKGFFKNLWGKVTGFFHDSIQKVKDVTHNIFGPIADFITKTWGKIKGFFSKTTKKISGSVSKNWNNVKNKTHSAFTGAKNIATKTWDGLKTGVTKTSKLAKKGISLYWQGVRKVTDTEYKLGKKIGTTAWNGLKTGVTKASNLTKKGVSKAWTATKNTTSNLYTKARNEASSMWSSLKKRVTSHSNTAKKNIGSAWSKMRSNTSNLYTKARNTASSLFSSLKTRVTKHATTTGSKVRSAWSTLKSKTSTMFENMRKTAVKKMGKIKSWAAKLPGKIGSSITSGAKHALNAIKSLANNMVKKFKHALGIKSPSRVFQKLGKFVIQGLSKGLTVGNMKDLGMNVLKDFGGGLFKSWKMIKGFFGGGTFKALKNFLSGGGFGGGKVSGSLKSWIAKAIGITGVPASWASGLATIAMHESGGKTGPSTINKWDSNWRRGTPSMGVMQTIKPTFDAFRVPGLGGIMDPVANIAAAINYIKHKYKNPYNTPGLRSLARGGPYIGYARGGIVNRRQFAEVAEEGPEGIIPLAFKRRRRALQLWARIGQRIGAFNRFAVPDIDGAGRTSNQVDYKAIGQAIAQEIERLLGDLTIQFPDRLTLLVDGKEVTAAIAAPMERELSDRRSDALYVRGIK